jgi:hypothetical protein
MNMNTNGIRSSVRVPVKLPVLLQWKTQAGTLREARGKTGNMSANGLLIIAPVRLPHDTRISFTVDLPEGVTKSPVRLHGQGRVVRQPSGRLAPGIGAIIDHYELWTLGSGVA